MLSLGPQHSFPLSDVFRYLHPETTKDVLVQAFLDAPVFKTRWRWNTTISLAVPRARGSRKVPPPIQRMLADDLMAAVFPDAALDVLVASGAALRSPLSQQLLIPWGGEVARLADTDTPMANRQVRWITHPFAVWEHPEDTDANIRAVRANTPGGTPHMPA